MKTKKIELLSSILKTNKGSMLRIASRRKN